MQLSHIWFIVACLCVLQLSQFQHVGEQRLCWFDTSDIMDGSAKTCCWRSTLILFWLQFCHGLKCISHWTMILISMGKEGLSPGRSEVRVSNTSASSEEIVSNRLLLLLGEGTGRWTEFDICLIRPWKWKVKWTIQDCALLIINKTTLGLWQPLFLKRHQFRCHYETENTLIVKIFCILLFLLHLVLIGCCAAVTVFWVGLQQLIALLINC